MADDDSTWPQTRVAFRDSLAGPTHGDNVRHLTVRSAFLSELLSGPEAGELIVTIARETGLAHAAAVATFQLDRFAALTGYPTRSSVWDAMATPERFIVQVGGTTDPAQVQSGYVAANAAVVAFLEAFELDRPTIRSMGRMAQKFVERHTAPWPWLALELMQSFLLQSHMLVFDFAIERSQWVSKPPVPPLSADLNVVIEAGTPLKEAQQQLHDVSRRLERDLREQAQPRGKIPDRSIPTLERNGRWFYRYAFAGQSFREIARSHFPSELHPESRRQDVRSGVNAARKVLEMTPFKFDGAGVIVRK